MQGAQNNISVAFFYHYAKTLVLALLILKIHVELILKMFRVFTLKQLKGLVSYGDGLFLLIFD